MQMGGTDREFIEYAYTVFIARPRTLSYLPVGVERNEAGTAQVNDLPSVLGPMYRSYCRCLRSLRAFGLVRKSSVWLARLRRRIQSSTRQRLSHFYVRNDS